MSESDNEMSNDKHKVVFEENNGVRVLRGTIIKEDEFFIYLERNDGIKRLAKRLILKTEEITDKNNLERGE